MGNWLMFSWCLYKYFIQIIRCVPYKKYTHLTMSNLFGIIMEGKFLKKLWMIWFVIFSFILSRYISHNLAFGTLDLWMNSFWRKWGKANKFFIIPLKKAVTFNWIQSKVYTYILWSRQIHSICQIERKRVQSVYSYL